MRTTTCLPLAALLSCTLGCEVPELETSPRPAAPAKQVAEAEEPEAEEEVDETPDSEPPVTPTPRAVTPNDPVKGKKSRAAGGYLGAIGHSRFYAEHKLIFDSITHVLNLYWGEHGEYPPSHEVFMDKIIKFNQIQLPQLEEGVEYIYDPEDHLLKIHRPEG